MSSKVAEANAKVHSLAMAVAVSSSPAAVQQRAFKSGADRAFWIACDQLEALR